jgi:hypothetical protein
MRVRHLVLLGFVCSIGMPSALAQESIGLRFEVVRSGSILAKPEVSVQSGSAGEIQVEGLGRFAFTPTVRGSNLAVAFDIESGEKHLEPQLVINKDVPGSLSWKSGPDGTPFQVTVFWVR